MEKHVTEITQQHTAEGDASTLTHNDCNEADDIVREKKTSDDGQECDSLTPSLDIPENLAAQDTVLPTESDETKLVKKENIGETAGDDSEETSGPTFLDCEKDISPPDEDCTSQCDEDIKEEDHTVKISAPETTTEDNQVDGHDPEDTYSDAGGDMSPASTKSKAETINSDEADTYTEQIKDIETIGYTSQDNEDTGILGGRKQLLIVLTIGVVLAILGNFLHQPDSQPQNDDMRQIDIFLRKLENLKSQFPNQRSELWNRSRIHLKRHLETAQPTEPVSLILTAGLRGKGTLHCLAHGLASAFSSALNASVLHIDGASKATQDSDKVKLDIDQSLQGAFEGNKPVAVIHRFEELPPGSTLIFYRYCDHENAAFKNTFLIFTVLLQEEEAIPPKLRLSDVEEMVDDHLQRKFLSHGHPVSFDRMDLDKYGGLWSRISHLILPVASEDGIERDGCKEA